MIGVGLGRRGLGVGEGAGDGVRVEHAALFIAEDADTQGADRDAGELEPPERGAPPGVSPGRWRPRARRCRWNGGRTGASSGCAGRGRTARPPTARATRPRGDRRLARHAAGRERPRKICGQKDRPTADGHVLVAAPAGYFAAFFLRSAQ